MKIEDYDFKWLGTGQVRVTPSDIAVVINTEDEEWIALYKEDVIELAKHFKITSEELNQDN